MDSPNTLISDSIDLDDILLENYLAEDFDTSAEFDDDESLSKDDYLDDDLVEGLYDNTDDYNIDDSDDSTSDFLFEDFI